MTENRSGIIIFDKPADYTSFDVVAKLRGILGIKKIGHAGTLDPMATGILVICVGKATKVVNLLTDMDKTYVAEMHLGTVTNTLDMTGEVIEERPVNVTEDEVRDAVMSMQGESDQVPPMYSAKKINGKKLYEIARQGGTVERKPHHINVYNIEIISMNLPDVFFKVSCSKGTYIRSIISDIGEKLGCGAAMKGLRRTKVGDFSIQNAVDFNYVEQHRDDTDLLITVDSLFKDMPGFKITDQEGSRRLSNGNQLSLDMGSLTDHDGINSVSGYDGRCLVYDMDGTFRAVYNIKDSILTPDTMF